MAKSEQGKKVSGAAPAVVVKHPGVSFSLTRNGAIAVVGLLLFVAVAAIYLVTARTGSLLWVSAALWLVFIGYWNAFATNSAPISNSESPASRQLHQLLMYGSLALAFIRVPGLGQRWLPAAVWLVTIGLCLHAGSALLAIWARRHLGRNWSGAVTAKVDHQLIRTGPYRVIRHPIYSGMLGMFLGTALVSGELHGLLAVLIIAVAYWRKIRLEEQLLSKVFGAQYSEYRQKSWALIPGLV